MLNWFMNLLMEDEPAAPKPVPGRNRLWINKKVLPLRSVDQHGFVADRNGLIIKEGALLKVDAHVDDLYGKFSFAPVVKITKVNREMFGGTWWFVLPDIAEKLAHYDATVQRALQMRR